MKANLLIMFWVESSRVAIEYPFLDMINMVGNICTKKMSFTRKLLAKIKKIVVPFKVFFIECDHGHSVFKFTLHFSHGSELLLFKVLKVTQDLSILQKVVQASHYQDHMGETHLESNAQPMQILPLFSHQLKDCALVIFWSWLCIGTGG